MKKLLILLLTGNLMFAQINKFVYQYKFIPDVNNMDSVSAEEMILDVSPQRSQFYSYKNYIKDSTALAYEQRGVSYMPPNQEYLNFRVSKDILKGEVRMVTDVGFKVYEVTQKPDIKWKITNKRKTHLGHELISAETDFGGRHWEAWYAPAIPIQDGPYKFFGLPGLILLLEDSTGSHRFAAEQIQTSRHETEYPETKGSKMRLHISEPQYRKLYREYRRDPLGDLRGRYPDQTDSAGNFRTGEEVFRESEKIWKERIKKDNNIIEMDLLQ